MITGTALLRSTNASIPIPPDGGMQREKSHPHGGLICTRELEHDAAALSLMRLVTGITDELVKSRHIIDRIGVSAARFGGIKPRIVRDAHEYAVEGHPDPAGR